MKQYHYIHIFFTILVTILMICCLLDYCSNIEPYSVKTNLTQFKKNNDPNDNSTITHVDIPKLKKSVKQLKKLKNKP